MSWCTDDKPKLYHSVNVTVETKHAKMRFVTEASWDGEAWRYGANLRLEERLNLTVLAWRPLPDPWDGST